MSTLKLAAYKMRCIFVCPGVDWADDYFLKDIERYKKIYKINQNHKTALAILLATKPEFRNLFIYRNRFRKIYRNWIKIFYRPMNTLYIETKEIGGGLFIQHGFATMIAAESIGENCWINQQVTIGFNGPGRAPIIGNDVMITCGAKVLGSITVGNGAVIGANAVVTKDVEPGAVMGGIPARRIR